MSDAKHTLGRITKDTTWKSDEWTLPCGCVTETLAYSTGQKQARTKQCRLHEVAPDLLEALEAQNTGEEDGVMCWCSDGYKSMHPRTPLDHQTSCCKASSARAKAKGVKP